MSSQWRLQYRHNHLQSKAISNKHFEMFKVTDISKPYTVNEGLETSQETKEDIHNNLDENQQEPTTKEK